MATIHYNIGILGYGKLGQFMADRILSEGDRLGLRLAFVWNRSAIQEAPNGVRILGRIGDIAEFRSEMSVDLIVEVCHPIIMKQFGAFLLEQSDLLVGSSTALADEECAQNMRQQARRHKHRLFIARGALWGANDIQRMARQNLLESVRVAMHFHPHSLRLPEGSALKRANDELLRDAASGESNSRSQILFEGPVRQVCQLAPNNVNTMATAALLGIGLDRTIGCLVADMSLTDHHRIEVEVKGIKRANTSGQFQVSCLRKSPTAGDSNVSSFQTYENFWQSLLECLPLCDNSAVHVC